MTADNPPNGMLRELCFEEKDLFDQERMIQHLDFLIQAWGEELLRKKYIEAIPDTDNLWMEVLERDIYWKDLKDQWDHYLVSSLIFFVLLRADIKRGFLLQPDNIRGQRLGRWLWRLKRYMTPLSREIVTQFCLCYSMILERKPIKVRYYDFSK
jgi:hypothetical protein